MSPSQKDKAKLCNSVKIRVSEIEALRIKEQAAEECLSVSAFIRKRLFPDWKISNRSKRPKPDYALYSDAMLGLGRIGSNVNQIARSLNRGRSVESEYIQTVSKELLELKSALMKALRLDELDA